VVGCCQHCTESYDTIKAQEYADQQAVVSFSRTLLHRFSYSVYYVIGIAKRKERLFSLCITHRATDNFSGPCSRGTRIFVTVIKRDQHTGSF
jgi:hypothetical protein